jgi:hypothetical protein
LVCVYSTKDLRVAAAAITEHAILISGERTELEPGSQTLGQIIAPVVEVDSGAVAAYPSAVVSIPDGGGVVVQRIRIHGGARVEGFVGLAGNTGAPLRDEVIEIDRGATVIGATCSDNRTTLEGTVIGSVLTRDFYFYETPTQFVGWIRNGVVDRGSLPSCFLLPMMFSGTSRLGVLDWL